MAHQRHCFLYGGPLVFVKSSVGSSMLSCQAILELASCDVLIPSMQGVGQLSVRVSFKCIALLLELKETCFRICGSTTEEEPYVSQV